MHFNLRPELPLLLIRIYLYALDTIFTPIRRDYIIVMVITK